MGFYSWLTADTKESIRARYSNEGAKTVYLLQPGKLDNIEEPCYEGYGRFGDVYAYEWLALINLPKKSIQGCSSDDLYDMGLNLEHGDYFEDVEDGSKWVYEGHVDIGRKYKKVLRYFEGNFKTPQSAYNGKTPNELKEEGRWVTKPLMELMELVKGKFKPLKFSFDKNAVYEDLPASVNDPTQGFFGELWQYYEEDFEEAIRMDRVEDLTRLTKELGENTLQELIRRQSFVYQKKYHKIMEDILCQ